MAPSGLYARLCHAFLVKVTDTKPVLNFKIGVNIINGDFGIIAGFVFF